MTQPSAAHDIEPSPARGLSVAFSTCAEALLNAPDARIVDDMRAVARAFGNEDFDGIAADDALRQRYYDRFFVPKTPYYVPLTESCVRGSIRDEQTGRITWGTTTSRMGDHALLCYRAAGFDPKSLKGLDVALGALAPDALSTEAAFAAYLALNADEAEDAAVRRRSWELFSQFVREHPGTWAPIAAKRLAASDDDFYARVCAFLAQLCDGVASLENA